MIYVGVSRYISTYKRPRRTLINGTCQTSLKPLAVEESGMRFTSRFITVHGVRDSFFSRSIPSSAGMSSETTLRLTLMVSVPGAVFSGNFTFRKDGKTASAKRKRLSDGFRFGTRHLMLEHFYCVLFLQ